MSLNENKKKLSSNFNVFWTKADSVNYFNQHAANKISFKDLCDEDKGRIADLVKEIAKLGIEKECVAKELEKERNQFDTKLNQIAVQQNALIQEKECLLQKLAETQDKLSKINDKRIENIDSIRKKAKRKQKTKMPSSTPQNTTPRSLSPIVGIETNSHKREFTKKIDDEINKIKSEEYATSNLNSPILHSTLIKDGNQPDTIHDIKRQQLYKQHIELIDEQKQLKMLLEQQELLLREKHNQIMLQQQAHRERLNQLSVNQDNKFGECQRNDQLVHSSHLGPFSRHDAATSPMRKRDHDDHKQPIIEYADMITQCKPLHSVNPTSQHSKSTSHNTTKQENNFLFDIIFEHEANDLHSIGNYNGGGGYASKNGSWREDDDTDAKLIEEIFFLS